MFFFYVFLYSEGVLKYQPISDLFIFDTPFLIVPRGASQILSYYECSLSIPIKISPEVCFYIERWMFLMVIHLISLYLRFRIGLIQTVVAREVHLKFYSEMLIFLPVNFFSSNFCFDCYYSTLYSLFPWGPIPLPHLT